MNRQWKQALLAVILGAFMPGLVLNAGTFDQTQQPEMATTATQQTQPTETETSFEISIIVQTGEGHRQTMELEAYILGVVLAEMPASFEMEALKAQAVVARTYTLRRMHLQDKHSGFAVCTNSSCCQAYVSKESYLQSGGLRADVAKVSQALRETAGQVLCFYGELAEATYFSCSGGRTEDAAAVWGTDIPYLQAVDSPGEESADNYTGSVHFSAAAFSGALGRVLDGNPESWLGKVTYTDGGGVDMMFIGGIGYNGTKLRQLLGLNSTAFFMIAENEGITVTTRGKGHRVGMSQYGADAMAVAGNNYVQILSHYYPGTVIDKVEDIE